MLQDLIDSYPSEIVDLSADQLSAAEFINIDDNQEFQEVPTVAQIIRELDKEDEEDAESEEETPSISHKKGLEHVQGLINYINQNENMDVSNEFMNNLFSIKKKIVFIEQKSRKQTSLTEFF